MPTVPNLDAAMIRANLVACVQIKKKTVSKSYTLVEVINAAKNIIRPYKIHINFFFHVLTFFLVFNIIRFFTVY